MSNRQSANSGDDEHTVRRRRVASTIDTNFRPAATSVPDLSVIATCYLDALRTGRPPIEALMEKFNVDRDSAKGWPALCRTAGLLPPRDQPQLAAAPEDTSHRFRIVR